MTSFHGLIDTQGLSAGRREGEGAEQIPEKVRKYTAWLSELRTVLYHGANGIQPLP